MTALKENRSQPAEQVSRAEGWKTVAGIQNSETSRLDRKMVKLVPKSPVCKGFLFLFHDVIISCCLGKHPYCLNCVKYTSRARGDTGVSLSPGVTSHMPRLQLGDREGTVLHIQSHRFLGKLL